MERLVLALITSARRLWLYFQAHLIQVVTNKMLKAALTKLIHLERFLKCSIELSKFNITYIPKTSVKAHAIDNFLVNFAQSLDVPVNSLHVW